MMDAMTRCSSKPAINLVTGEGASELREAIEQARQNPGQPCTAGEVTVTWFGEGGKQVIEWGGPDPAKAPIWDLR